MPGFATATSGSGIGPLSGPNRFVSIGIASSDAPNHNAGGGPIRSAAGVDAFALSSPRQSRIRETAHAATRPPDRHRPNPWFSIHNPKPKFGKSRWTFPDAATIHYMMCRQHINAAVATPSEQRNRERTKMINEHARARKYFDHLRPSARPEPFLSDASRIQRPLRQPRHYPRINLPRRARR